jgi:hypothetical protein
LLLLLLLLLLLPFLMQGKHNTTDDVLSL